MKIDGNLLIFIKNFRTDRQFNGKIYDKISSTHIIENSLPQVSVLSIKILMKAINYKNVPDPVKCIILADECNIYCSETQIKTTTNFLQQALGSVSRWSSETGPKFLPQNSVLYLLQKEKWSPTNNLLHKYSTLFCK